MKTLEENRGNVLGHSTGQNLLYSAKANIDKLETSVQQKK
jgi:hypothetical protein